MRSVAGGIDAIEAVFDDGSLVADAGLLLAGTVMSRLGLEALIDDTVRLGGSAGAGAGRKVLTLASSALVGGRCIDDTDRLRSGSAGAVLPFEVMAPSTEGTFLRSFTFGHVRQLDKALESAQMRAWSVGAAPAVAELTVDLDSTVCEVCGKAKHGACYGHTKVLGYHPLVAVRADTGEVLHSRMRSGSSQRGHEHFAREALARVRRLAADATVTVRADSGFFSYDMIAAIAARGASYSITIPQNAKVKAANEAIGERAWKAITYTRGAEAQVAETTIEPGRRGDKLPRGDDGEAAKPAPRHAAQPRARRPTRAVARLALPQLRHRPRRPRHQSSRRLPPKPRHSRARHQRPQRRLRAQPLPLGTVPRQRRLARLLRPRAQPRPLDRPPRQSPPHTTTHRRGHHPQPAPHRHRAASSTTAAATDCACRSTGHGHTPSPPPWDTSATCPNSSDPPLSAPRSAAEPHAPPTRTSPAPQSCTPQNAPARTHAPAQRPPGPNRRSHKPVGGFRLRTVRDSLPSYGSHSPAFFCLGRSVGSSPEGLTSTRP